MYVTYRLASCNSRGACPASLFFCVLQESLGLVQLESRDIDLWCRTAIQGNKTPHWGRKRSTARTISALLHSSIFLQACAKERWHAFDIGFTQLRTICWGRSFLLFTVCAQCDFLLSCNSPLKKKQKQKTLSEAGPSYSKLKSGLWNSRLRR